MHFYNVVFIKHFVSFWFNSAAAAWRPIRKHMNSSFSSIVVQSFVPVLNVKVKLLLEKMDNHANNGDEFDVLPFINVSTLDAICGKRKLIRVLMIRTFWNSTTMDGYKQGYSIRNFSLTFLRKFHEISESWELRIEQIKNISELQPH